ncbi:MAG TPA: hypothetical protein VEL28_13115 [Candidatus Binatia bacterium]|nr:hypothetical protein [Candidatus Binatia bacterium]
MATAAELKTRLQEVEEAIHDVMKNGGVAEYRLADGRFVKRDLAQLRAHKAELQGELASISGGGTTFASFGAIR